MTFHFNVTPNPFSNVVNIEVKNCKDEFLKCTLYSVTGATIKSFEVRNNSTFELDEFLNAGIYVLSYTTSNGSEKKIKGR